MKHLIRGVALAMGGHGVPLIDGGDWNDGMNRVGEGGKGESVWLGWLLHAALANAGFELFRQARDELTECGALDGLRDVAGAGARPRERDVGA